jgi:hypothetical protein
MEFLHTAVVNMEGIMIIKDSEHDEEYPVFEMERGTCPITAAAELASCRDQRYRSEVMMIAFADKHLKAMMSVMAIIYQASHVMIKERRAAAKKRELRCYDLEVELLDLPTHLLPPHPSINNAAEETDDEAAEETDDEDAKDVRIAELEARNAELLNMVEAMKIEIEDCTAATKDGRTAVQKQRVLRTQKRRIEDLERKLKARDM